MEILLNAFSLMNRIYGELPGWILVPRLSFLTVPILLSEKREKFHCERKLTVAIMLALTQKCVGL